LDFPYYFLLSVHGRSPQHLTALISSWPRTTLGVTIIIACLAIGITVSIEAHSFRRR
jgi:hypothetical protein